MRVKCDSIGCSALCSQCGGAKEHDSRDCESCPATTTARCVEIIKASIVVAGLDAADKLLSERSMEPPLNGWAPGTYDCVCSKCNRPFVGDKRAVTCHRCAYEARFIKVLLPLTYRQVEAVTRLYHPNIDNASEGERNLMLKACKDWVECIITNALTDKRKCP